MLHLRRTLALILAHLALASAALAEIPPALDRVPADAFAVVAAENLAALDENTAQLLAAVEIDTISTFSQALGAMGLRDGLNLKGSAAGVFYPANEKDAPPDLVLLLPVSDYGALMATLKARREGESDRFDYAGQTYFARAVDGGYAVAGASRTLVEGFTAAPGNLPGHLGAMGARGRQIATGADIVALADTAQARALLAGVLGPLAQNAPGFGALAADPGADPRLSIVGAILARVESEGARAVIGLTTGPLGLRMDLATQFREASFMHAACSSPPRPLPDLPALPRGDFVFLGSMHPTHPGLRAVIDEALRPRPQAPAPASDLARGILSAVREMDDATVVVYTPQNFFMGALARSVVTWRSAKPALGAQAFRQWLASLDGQPVGTTKVSTSFQDFAFRVNDTPVSAWSIAADGGALGPSAVLLYANAAGPHGFISVGAERGWLTWSRDQDLLTGAMNAAAGEGSLASDIMLQQVRELLPGPRAIEWAINARPILAQAASFAGQKTELPELLPPIGAGVVMADGAMHTTLFVPSPLIKSAFTIMNAVGAAPPRERPPERPAERPAERPPERPPAHPPAQTERRPR